MRKSRLSRAASRAATRARSCEQQRMAAKAGRCSQPGSQAHTAVIVRMTCARPFARAGRHPPGPARRTSVTSAGVAEAAAASLGSPSASSTAASRCSVSMPQRSAVERARGVAAGRARPASASATPTLHSGAVRRVVAGHQDSGQSRRLQTSNPKLMPRARPAANGARQAPGSFSLRHGAHTIGCSVQAGAQQPKAEFIKTSTRNLSW